MWIELLIFSIIGSILFYRWATKNNDFFKKRDIPYDKPIFIFGSSKEILLRKKSVLQVLCEIYNKHNGIAYGTFDNRDPILMIRDPELIKHIMIKDFDHFINHRSFFVDGDANLFNASLIMMENEKWRDMRSTLSPAFTGSKMRHMFQLILQTVDEAMAYLKEQQKGSNAQDGFECLKIDVFGKAFMDYFMRLVLDAMKYRQENNIHRPDMINLLMEARGLIPTDTPKTHFRQWSDTELVAQCFLFFFAGFVPSSGVMNFAAHELMEYPQIQDKLFVEIQEVDEQLEGKPITYEILQKMTYMDMVVLEVLRKWPVTLVTDRACNKDFVYESAATGERIEIKKNDVIRVAMCAIQRDPKYYENPEILNPERFSAENKSGIDSGTYMPFGLGPRNCIGNRFAVLEIKAFLYYLIRDYRLDASPKSCVPLELNTSNFELKPKNGFWLQFKPRK